MKSSNNENPKTINKRRFSGIVVSDKMDKTRVVAVEDYKKHPKYGKFIHTSKKYKAHDGANVTHIGDKVTIEECRPISKDKHFVII
ncbi:MAG TPA: 30S ribosomal protein S17 [Candidatus Paceibacterota bacterium]